MFARSSYDAGFRVILKTDKVALDRVTLRESILTLGETTHQPKVMLGYGTGGIHEAAHRTMMILKNFDLGVYQIMVDDFVRYLDNWEPYYQHSVWLITGSKWQLGIPKVLEGLGPEGEPIVLALKRVQKRFDSFDRKRIGKAGADLETQIQAAIDGWEAKKSEQGPLGGRHVARELAPPWASRFPAPPQRPSASRSPRNSATMAFCA